LWQHPALVPHATTHFGTSPDADARTHRAPRTAHRAPRTAHRAPRTAARKFERRVAQKFPSFPFFTKARSPDGAPGFLSWALVSPLAWQKHHKRGRKTLQSRPRAMLDQTTSVFSQIFPLIIMEEQ